MPSKTEVSERARKCAEQIRIAFIAANKDMSLWACISDDKVASIIDRHFAAYEEFAQILTDYAATWKGAHTNCQRPVHCLVCRAKSALRHAEPVEERK